jgi:Ca2+-binding EF-hand superfamily protein
MTEMIDAMDTSGDGQISFPEFCMFLRALAAADKASATV